MALSGYDYGERWCEVEVWVVPLEQTDPEVDESERQRPSDVMSESDADSFYARVPICGDLPVWGFGDSGKPVSVHEGVFLVVSKDGRNVKVKCILAGSAEEAAEEMLCEYNYGWFWRYVEVCVVPSEAIVEIVNGLVAPSEAIDPKDVFSRRVRVCGDRVIW